MPFVREWFQIAYDSSLLMVLLCFSVRTGGHWYGVRDAALTGGGRGDPPGRARGVWPVTAGCG